MKKVIEEILDDMKFLLTALFIFSVLAGTAFIILYSVLDVFIFFEDNTALAFVSFIISTTLISGTIIIISIRLFNYFKRG